MNDKINYRKGGDEVRKAWFAYKADNTDCTANPKKITSFVAGWNAAMASLKSAENSGN
jgi:hypothetical protein